ncbi:MAG: cellulase family glycosylhydrolase [Xanthomonadales bacterium]
MNRLVVLGLSALLALASAPFAIGAEPPQQLVLGTGTNLAHWLSQTRREGAERRNFITEDDIVRIAELGFDHVRIPIDEMQMWDEQGVRDADAFETLHDGIRWSLDHGLKVLVDLHILRSHHFNAEDKPLWTDPAEQERFIDLWRDLSAALRDYPVDRVAYELMNEPVADDPDDWNRLVARAFAAVRALEPERSIVIGSRIILSYHFYEPFALTHYQAGWTDLKDYTGPVRYPGVIVTRAEFDAMPKDQQAPVERFAGREFNRDVLVAMMEKPLRKARELGLPLYCGEFGVFNKAPAPDRERWYRDMLSIFAEHGVSWANWNYKSDQFGLIGLDGEPIPAVRDVIVEALRSE